MQMPFLRRCAILAAITASLAFAGCASGQPASNPAPMGPDSTLARLRAHLDTSDAILARYRGRVVVHRDSLRAPQAVSAKELDQALRGATTEVLRGIPGPELQPLRDYLSARAPSSADALVVACAFEGGKCVSEGAADSLWSRLTKALGAVRSDASNLRVDIDVESRPDGAQVELLRKDGRRERVGFANTAFRGVYRGLYDYRVTLEGYQPLTSELDLVEDPGTRLVCALKRTSDHAQFTVCRLEKPLATPSR